MAELKMDRILKYENPYVYSKELRYNLRGNSRVNAQCAVGFLRNITNWNVTKQTTR